MYDEYLFRLTGLLPAGYPAAYPLGRSYPTTIPGYYQFPGTLQGPGKQNWSIIARTKGSWHFCDRFSSLGIVLALDNFGVNLFCMAWIIIESGSISVTKLHDNIHPQTAKVQVKNYYDGAQITCYSVHVRSRLCNMYSVLFSGHQCMWCVVSVFYPHHVGFVYPL